MRTRRRTVLVIGAGGSAEFGFPTSLGLLASIRASLADSGSPLATVLRDAQFDQTLIHAFAQTLRSSPRTSVDAFLEDHREFADVGRAAISAALIPLEDPKNLLPPSRSAHWYQYVFNALGRNSTEFSRSELSVVTFNYDRSFDHFWISTYRQTYTRGALQQDDSHAQWLLDAAPVVHVYGVLGNLLPGEGYHRPYSPELTSETVRGAASCIDITFPREPLPGGILRARELLEEAHRVCFIGFGYGTDNLRRIRADALPPEVEVYGTARGLTRPRRAEVASFFEQRITLADDAASIVDLLDEHTILTRRARTTSARGGHLTSG